MMTMLSGKFYSEAIYGYLPDNRCVLSTLAVAMPCGTVPWLCVYIVSN